MPLPSDDLILIIGQILEILLLTFLRRKVGTHEALAIWQRCNLLMRERFSKPGLFSSAHLGSRFRGNDG